MIFRRVPPRQSESQGTCKRVIGLTAQPEKKCWHWSLNRFSYYLSEVLQMKWSGFFVILRMPCYHEKHNSELYWARNFTTLFQCACSSRSEELRCRNELHEGQSCGTQLTRDLTYHTQQKLKCFGIAKIFFC